MTTPTNGPEAGPGNGLGNTHVLLTGATGFLGQALLERLLAAHPDTRISLLVRPQTGTTAADRVRAMLDRPVFRVWRESVGQDAAERAVRQRITVLEGDLGNVPPLPADLDVVLHSASAVSFDQPIDEAFRTNVLGAERLYQALLDSGADPHVVHVSTAYVNAGRRGIVTESSLEHAVDWRAEADAARFAREQAEAESRRPSLLNQLRARMLRRYGKIGPQAAAAATERARADWVNDRLVEQGRSRALGLGWTDVYTLTKACAERVGEQLWSQANRRLSFVRPSIIESAVRQPFPGWLDGIKVADPLILAYGRGLLRTFPGIPDTVIDIVPIDVVANAVLAVAAAPGGRGGAGYYHVTSGARNPLPMHELYRVVGEYFAEHPFERDGSPVGIPPADFGGSRRFERRLRTYEGLIDAADAVVGRLPSGPRSRRWSDELTKRGRQVASLRMYGELYCAYVQTEVVFDDRRTKALHDALTESAKPDYGFDVGAVCWRDYLTATHVPSVIGMTEQRRRPGAAAPAIVATELPPRGDVLAVFDLEGTVVGLNLVEQYLAIRLAQLPRHRWPAELARTAASLPGLLQAERRDRGEFIRALAHRYRGMPTEAVDHLTIRRFGDAIRRHTIDQALEQAGRHRAAGHRTVLVTGAPRWAAEPFVDQFDEIVAGTVHSDDGVMTGYLAASPLVGEARANWLRGYAASVGADLSASYGYGDSYADVAWLEVVGQAHAINPDARLYRHARQAKWTVRDWS